MSLYISLKIGRLDEAAAGATCVSNRDQLHPRSPRPVRLECEALCGHGESQAAAHLVPSRMEGLLDELKWWWMRLSRRHRERLASSSAGSGEHPACWGSADAVSAAVALVMSHPDGASLCRHTSTGHPLIVAVLSGVVRCILGEGRMGTIDRSGSLSRGGHMSPEEYGRCPPEGYGGGRAPGQTTRSATSRRRT